MLTLPGLIDAHVHLRDPGQTHKEDFITGTSAALAGGFTTILDMPNNTIPITTQERLLNKKNIAKNKILCDVGFYFGSLGDNLTQFSKIQNKVYGLKIFLNQTTGNFVINLDKFRQVCDAWPNPPDGGRPILLHAEENILEQTITIARKANQRVHICHVSSKRELQMILNAKQKGWRITCGVTPHHLFLNNNDSSRLNELGTVKPNLKPKSDVDFLWQHIKDVDIIESDHAPHTIQEKGKGAFGFPGLETTLPLLLTAAHQEKLTIDDIIRLCHTNPTKIFKIDTIPQLQSKKSPQPPLVKGATDSFPLFIKEGSREISSKPKAGDLTDEKNYIVIDENEEWTIKNENLFTKSKWSPFNGYKVKGRIKKVILRGTTLFENGKILAKPGFGNVIH